MRNARTFGYVVILLSYLLSTCVRCRIQLVFPRNGDVIQATYCRDLDFLDANNNNDDGGDGGRRRGLGGVGGGYCLYKFNVVNWWSKESMQDKLCLTRDPNEVRYQMDFSGIQKANMSCGFFNTDRDGLGYEEVFSVKIPREAAALDFHWAVTDMFSNIDIISGHVTLILVERPPPPPHPPIEIISGSENTLAINLFHLGLKKCPTDIVSSKCSLDFIEIGTSNFDTCAQKLAGILNGNNNVNVNGAAKLHHSAGISIEPVIDYLSQLPNSEFLVKVNAAIIGDEANSNHEAVVYYVPETTLIKFRAQNFTKGCTAVNNIHMELFYLVNRHNYPAEIVQRRTVPAISMYGLLREVHSVAGIHRIRLLKLDVEGMDLDLIESMLDYYSHDGTKHKDLLENLESDMSISGGGNDVAYSADNLFLQQLPCLVSFESSWGKGHVGWNINNRVREVRAEAINERLKLTGFLLANDALKILGNISKSEADSKFFDENNLAINCNCYVDDIYKAGLYLDDFDPRLPIEMCKIHPPSK